MAQMTPTHDGQPAKTATSVSPSQRREAAQHDKPSSASSTCSAGPDQQLDSSSWTGQRAGSASQAGRARQPDDQPVSACRRASGLAAEGRLAEASQAPGRVGLLYCSREPLRLKDFGAEVRAPMDVEQFAHQAELVLDTGHVSIDDIVESMLDKVFESEQIGGDKLREARRAIFIQDSSMLMARTIQGTTLEMDQGNQEPSMKYDQSWLCALCNLAQVARRHMVIARFRQPINMGENAHEVRLFVLIVCPTQEKDTKRELETGRTFATMLTDNQFRRLLLRASTETEFKSLVVVRAQQLARTTRLKNRHKYMLDAALNQSLSSLASDSLQQANGSLSSRLGAGCRYSPATISKLVGSTTSGRGLFGENPRTTKLFELINSPQHSIELADPTIDGKYMSDLILDKFERKLAGLEEDKKTKRRKSGCCWRVRWSQLQLGQGLWQDFRRRIRYYPSDFRDAFVGPPRTIQKTVATTWFLYFGILLPTIAFSSLNTTQTHGHMGDLRKAIIGQAVGGLGFALLGGQPLVIIMTTAPLCLYTKVIHQMCIDYGFHFPAMYAAVGLWNGFFLLIYSLFGFSKLMKWCTRSTEEIFALFIVVAFVTDASKDMIKNFHRFYYTPACEVQSDPTTPRRVASRTSQLLATVANSTGGKTPTELEDVLEGSVCRRETSLLFVLLMLGTLWLATTLYRFKKTPYLSAGKRELLADYALPTAVLLMSFVGSYVFDDIYVEKFPPIQEIHFERAQLELLPLSGILTSLGLGFTLSLLFFMDQNISAAMVNAPQNRLKKGCAYHYDLFVVGLLNVLLALYGLPMMHGVLPHSPLHVRSLADIEEQVEEGHLREVIVNCRETRVTGIVSHILVLASLLLIPYPIAYIPRAVLDGLFLYMAITSLDGLQIFERILLLFTEQNKYPPNHYIRRCPQRKIHKFTILQLFQLLVMCLFGFSPINTVEMLFPVIILLMIPFRHKIVPKYIDEKYLDALDGKH